MKNSSYLLITYFVILLDQITKFIIELTIKPGQIIRITDKFFWLTFVQNSGAAFSLSTGNKLINRLFFIAVTIVAVVLIYRFYRKTEKAIEKIAFALILGGAIGNLIDRIYLGKVTDFLWCDFPDFIMQRWPVFNIADSSIVVAISLLLIFFVFFKKSLEDK